MMKDSGHNKKSCLLVDDSEDSLKIFAKILEPHFDISRADNGLVAWNLFLEETFDLVVCDFVMPVMNGIELASKIRAKGSDIPFFLVTGFDVIDLEDFNREIKRLKINNLLLKPLKNDDFQDILRLSGSG